MILLFHLLVVLVDYIGFMKKALVLLRAYPLIKRVDLEVVEVDDVAPGDVIPPIRTCVTCTSFKQRP
jgi:hypothetical protein